MKLSAIFAALGTASCLLAVGCATFPKRVQPSLTVAQPHDASVRPGSAATDMIAWEQPPLHQPEAPVPLTSATSFAACGGWIGTLFSEYHNIHGTQMQLIHGTTAASQFSGNDFSGTHRFKDWNILMVVEPEDETLLATANSFSQGGWEDDSLASRLAVENPDLDKLAEVEWDTGFFAPEMAPGMRDETLVVGTWIFDCGHESTSKTAPPKSLGFRSEIHAPAIVVSSHVVQSDPTRVQARFRMFAGSRSGPLRAVPLVFFITKFFASYKIPLGGTDYSVNLHAPGKGWKIASCTIAEGARSGGRPRRVSTIAKSEDNGNSLTWTLPARNLKPSAKFESSAIVDVSWVRADSSSSGRVTQCESSSAIH